MNRKKQPRKKWSDEVTKHSNALDLEDKVVKGSPASIARSLKRSAEHSRRRKSRPVSVSEAMLTFYINRARICPRPGAKRLKRRKQNCGRRSVGRPERLLRVQDIGELTFGRFLNARRYLAAAPAVEERILGFASTSLARVRAPLWPRAVRIVAFLPPIGVKPSRRPLTRAWLFLPRSCCAVAALGLPGCCMLAHDARLPA